jgi:hypothetical protein
MVPLRARMAGLVAAAALLLAGGCGKDAATKVVPGAGTSASVAPGAPGVSASSDTADANGSQTAVDAEQSSTADASAATSSIGEPVSGPALVPDAAVAPPASCGPSRNGAPSPQCPPP